MAGLQGKSRRVRGSVPFEGRNGLVCLFFSVGTGTATTGARPSPPGWEGDTHCAPTPSWLPRTPWLSQKPDGAGSMPFGGEDALDCLATGDGIARLDEGPARSGPFARYLHSVGYGPNELTVWPESTGVLPLPWSCGTPTVTLPVHVPPLPSEPWNAIR
jgi:hypothetical protein